MIDYPAEAVPTDAVVTELVTPRGVAVALVTVTNGSERRPATLGPQGLENLDRALDEIQSRGSFGAVIVTGHGRTFCAGADLDMLSSPPDDDAALALAREGHRVLSRLSSFGIPVIAAINGTALGGGLELALHCTARVSIPTAGPLGLPEVGLGLIPGWGGVTLLPALVGWDRALTVIVDNAIAGRTLSASQAKELGIVDRIADDLLTESLRYIDDVSASPHLSAPHTDSSDSTEIVAMVEGRLARYLSRTGNPLDALTQLRTVCEVVATSNAAAGFAAEDAALATLMQTVEFRRRLYSFRVTSAAMKQPAGTPEVPPSPVTKLGVVGAGLMASQIALAVADSLDCPVVITDIDQTRLNAAKERMSDWLSARVTKKTLTDARAVEILNRVHSTLDWKDFADCDLVIEAVFEDLSVKHEVLMQLERVVPANTIIASNTSSLSIDDMASFVHNPERIAGIHFFNPVSVMKLVEVVRGSRQSDECLATAIDLTRRMGKTPVLVADRPGFVVNRLLTTFLGEALRVVEEGTSAETVSHALGPLRLPMSPFELIDLIGRTVTLKMMESVQSSAPDRFFVGAALPTLVTGDSSTPFATELTKWTDSSTDEKVDIVHDRIVDALAREVRVMLDEHVVDTVFDIDVCMINGAGWPAAIGGLTPYLDGCGASRRATGKLFHPRGNFC